MIPTFSPTGVFPRDSWAKRSAAKAASRLFESLLAEQFNKLYFVNLKFTHLIIDHLKPIELERLDVFFIAIPTFLCRYMSLC